MIGDHIRALVGGEWRHAIDCGDGTVLHLTSDAAATPAVRVRRSYRPEFVAGATQVEVVVHRERVFAVRQVVLRAYSRASNPSLAAMFEGSAAFASWCKAGHPEDRSENVVRPVPALVQVPGPVAVPTPPSTTAKPAVKPAAASPRAAAKPAAAKKPTAKRAPLATKKAAAKAKSAAKKVAPAKRKTAAKAKPAKTKPGAKKPAARSARRPAPKAPAKARGRAAARRNGPKGRGARR